MSRVFGGSHKLAASICTPPSNLLAFPLRHVSPCIRHFLISTSHEQSSGSAEVSKDSSNGVGSTSKQGTDGAKKKEAGAASDKEASVSKMSDEEKRKAMTEEEKEMRTVFVGNLPTSFTTKKVKAVFKDYGAVESVRLRSVAVEGMAVDKAGDQVTLYHLIDSRIVKSQSHFGRKIARKSTLHLVAPPILDRCSL